MELLTLKELIFCTPKMGKHLALTAILFFLSVLCCAQNIDSKSWVEDIDFYHKTLEEKHIDLYHTISKEDFIKELKALKAKLPELTNFQVIVSLMRLTHKIGNGRGDGHTSVPLWGTKTSKFPIKLFDFDGELRVTRAAEKYSNLLGKRLIKIEDTPIHEVYQKVKELTPFTENKQSSMDRTCQYMMVSELLGALGTTKRINSATFTFVDPENKEEQIILNSYSKESLDKFEYKATSISHSKIVRPKDTKFDDLWFTSLNNSKTVYIKFKHYPSEEEMNAFAQSVYNYIEEHKSENLIIDLRDNYGGDFFIGLILSSWLNAADSINWKSGVYVLTDRVTYSAAMVNALQYRQLLNAKIVGEPTGANPNGYQDLGQFNLPNSNLLITYTKRLFRLQDKNTQGVQPDVLITPKWSIYKKGIDEVLNWVLNDLKE